MDRGCEVGGFLRHVIYGLGVGVDRGCEVGGFLLHVIWISVANKIPLRCDFELFFDRWVPIVK